MNPDVTAGTGDGGLGATLEARPAAPDPRPGTRAATAPRSGVATAPRSSAARRSSAGPSAGTGHVGGEQLLARRPLQPQRGEPLLLASMAVAATLTCWSTGAGRQGWVATATLVLLAAWSLRRDRTGAGISVAARALGVEVTALVTTLAVPGTATLALACVVGVAAFYPVLLSRRPAAVVTSGAVVTVCLPILGRLLAGDVEVAGDPGAMGRLTAGAVIAGLGLAARHLRDALAEAEVLAEQRRALARTARNELVRLTSSDELTGLPNRPRLLRRITQAMARSDVIGGQVALFVLEVDRFTAVTDTLGAAAGDEVLRQVARRLRASMPAEDLVARIGSRRFAVLVEGVGPEGCTGMARRMAALLEEPMTGGGRTVSITCSIGIAVAGPDLDSAEDLLGAAAEAVQAALRSGRARWATYDHAMRAHTRLQGTLEIELRQAMLDRTLTVAYQPIVALGRPGRPDLVEGLEALARWTRDDGSAVPPLRFVPVAEEIGLGRALALQVLDQGLTTLRELLADAAGPRWLSVNLGPSQLDDPDFARIVAERLALHELTPAHLVIDVPASSFVDTEQTRSTLGMLRSLGVRVAVDDFGRTGMSLAALRQLPVTEVKLDRQLTAELGNDDTVPAAVVALTSALGMRCVAEGIETQPQLDAARALGVDAVQGFLIARPATAVDLPHVLSALRAAPCDPLDAGSGRTATL